MRPPTDLQPSRRVATTWNVVFAYGAVGLALVRNLALVPVFLHYIESREFGAWLATGGVLAYLLMLDFGLMGVVGQRTAEAYGGKRLDSLGRRVGTSLGITVGLMLLSAALSAAVAPLVPGMMKIEGDAAGRLVVCFLIVCLANSVNLLALATRAVLRSLQRPLVPGLADLGSELAGIALTLILLVDGHGLYAVALGLGLRGLLNAVVNTAGCLWICRRVLALRIVWDGAEAVALWRSSFHQFFTAVATRLQSRSDAFFVGWILGPESALVYALTTRAHETVRLVAIHLVAGVQPSLAHLHGGQNRGRFKEIVVTMVIVTATISGVGMCGVIAFNGAFMRLWVEPELYGGLLLTALVAGFGYIAELGSAQYGTLMAMGEFRRLCRVVWEGTLVRLPLLIVFLMLFGLWGAAVAAIAGAAVQTIRSSGQVIGLLGFRPREIAKALVTILRSTLPPVVLATLVVAVGFQPTSWTGLFASAAGFAALATALATLANPGVARQIGGEVAAIRGGRGAGS